MREAIKKIVLSLFPELVGQYHLPQFAKVLAVADPPAAGDLCDPFRPRYAVDIVMLDAQGQRIESMIFEAVPVSVPGAGEGAGLYSLPRRGTVVEVAFAYGLPSKPFVRGVLPTWKGLAAVEAEGVLLQPAPGTFLAANHGGDWLRQSPGAIDDKSTTRSVEAIDQVLNLVRQVLTVAEDSGEFIGGTKLIEALGALRLLSGGSLNLTAVDNVNITTAADVNITSGRNHKEAIEGIKDSLAKLKQRVTVAAGGVVWVGDDSSNVLRILSDLIQVVSDIASTAAGHTHGGVQTGPGSTAAPDTAGTFNSQSSAAGALKSELDPITET